MKNLLIIIASLFCITANAQQKPNTLSSNEKSDGWKLLFDGKTTKGWHGYNISTMVAAWKVADGALCLDTAQKDKGDIVSEKAFSNFHLKLQWKIAKNGNSGIIFYVQEDAKYDATYKTGMEMQVLDNDGHPDGKISKHRAGDLYDLIKSSSEPVQAVGEWNDAEIVSDHGKLTLILNGVTVVATTLWDEGWASLIAGSKFKNMPGFGTFKSGKIALQDHGNVVCYRNIKVKEL
jgi:hypothetical protein